MMFLCAGQKVQVRFNITAFRKNYQEHISIRCIDNNMMMSCDRMFNPLTPGVHDVSLCLCTKMKCLLTLLNSYIRVCKQNQS